MHVVQWYYHSNGGIGIGSSGGVVVVLLVIGAAGEW